MLMRTLARRRRWSRCRCCSSTRVAGEPCCGSSSATDLTAAAGRAAVLGVAMSLLACGYLAVQYLLALGRVAFLSRWRSPRSPSSLLLAAVGSQLTDVAFAVDRARASGSARRACSRSASRSAAGPRAARAARERHGRGAARRAADGVEGWLTEAQARRLWDARAAAAPGAARSSRSAASAGARRSCWRAPRRDEVVAIDPHAGSDRGPQEIAADAGAGDADHERVPREPRARRRGASACATCGSSRADALGEVEGAIDAALRRRRAPLRPGARRPRPLGRARRARRDDARARRVLLDRRHARAAAPASWSARAGATSGRDRLAGRVPARGSARARGRRNARAARRAAVVRPQRGDQGRSCWRAAPRRRAAARPADATAPWPY